MTNKMALIVAVVLGILSIIGIRSYVDQIKKQSAIDVERINYMVAANDLDAGHVMTQDDLEQKPFIKATIVEALKGTAIAVGDEAPYLGARLRSKLKAGQLLLKDHFADSGGAKEDSDPSKKLGADERMFTIPVTGVSGMDGLIRPGDFVDVIVTMDASEGGGGFMITRTLLRGAPVLATGNNTSRYGGGGIQGGAGLYETITLRVTTKEANKLAFCLYGGANIHLTKLKEGTAAQRGFDPVTNQTILSDIANEVRMPAGGGRR
ncbi:MAG: Flp pilus assembly protein CpaB [Planctomycetota bacterium]